MRFWCASLSTPSDGTQLTWHTSKRDAEKELNVMKQTYYRAFLQSERPEGQVNSVEIEPTRGGIVSFLNEHLTSDNG
jgi:hypothetical protein